ncbi:Predicted short chain-type dehydrogenase [Phaffia rhodozyma]|uniref:Predicted short chain-type dehydrogenase n=1 Tax=Phaffia rhodozyma TaxID=264483 RepID=A0A0F7SMJ1_PHARH|nr:Predicted short chain-type dehydrogenase [Phaffia rhodozyma]
MNIAVILGSSSGGIGSHLAQHILRSTALQVVALSSRPTSQTLDALLSGSSNSSQWKDRVIPFQVDALSGSFDAQLQKAARDVEQALGKNVRLIVCSSGILHPEKSISQIDPAHSIESYKLNTLSHLLTYKHFTPLIPTIKQFETKSSSDNFEDPAKGLLKPGLGACVSLSARVGTGTPIDPAVNQTIKTLNLELKNKKSSAISLAYHPGTTKTTLSSPFISSSTPSSRSKGLFEPTEAVEELVNVLSGLEREKDGGGFRDWKGDEVPW